MKKVQTIITTDVEVDDMNSLIHLCLYLNQMDVLAFIYTSSQYHFLGDGIHTLGEITPDYRCSGPGGLRRPRTTYGPDPEARDIKSFRPFEKGWIEKLWDNEYRDAYPHLIKHDPSYPSPEHLLDITLYGNIEFEGDVRFDTEGSDFIKEELLRDKEELLYLQSWGGVNTIVRALLSIYEQYHDSDNWETVYKRIIRRVRLLGVRDYVGQDNSYLHNRINELYPDLVILHSQYFYGVYGYSDMAPENCREMFRSSWMKDNIHDSGSALMASYRLYGDGKPIPGEAEVYQFGLNSTLDFAKPGVPPRVYEPFTFLGEGDSNCYIPLLDFGLHGLADKTSPTILGHISHGNSAYDHDLDHAYFIKAYQEDFAARAQWCTENGNSVHPLEIEISEKEITASPGKRVTVSASVTDRDGRGYEVSWLCLPDYSNYQGTERILPEPAEETSVSFNVPGDSRPGDSFLLIIQACHIHQTPITSFGEVRVNIE